MNTLIHGIDTLSIGYKCSWIDPDMLKQFKAIKQMESLARQVRINGIDFEIMGYGHKNYTYILNNSDCSIYCTSEAKGGEFLPEIYITWRSSFLWSQGWRLAVSIIDTWLKKWATWTEAVPSRVDLCADIKTDVPIINLSAGEADTRARKRTVFRSNEYYTGKEISGYQFGNSDLVCRIYNKLHEIGLSKKEWFETLWGKEGWLKGEPVTRIEFQCRRNYLKEMQVNSIYELEKTLPDIWRLCTNWINIRTQNLKDSNNRRWQITELWKLIKKSWTGTCAGVSRWVQRRNSLEHARKMTMAYAASFVSLSSIDLLAKELCFEYESNRFKQKVDMYKARFCSFESPLSLDS